MHLVDSSFHFLSKTRFYDITACVPFISREKKRFQILVVFKTLHLIDIAPKEAKQLLLNVKLFLKIKGHKVRDFDQVPLENRTDN